MATLKLKLAVVAGSLLVVGAVGGTALASSGGKATGGTKPPVTSDVSTHQANTTSEPVDGPDTDNVQQGDQTTPDKGAAANEAPESPSSEPEGAESDGPGGHADPPGNVDHQFQGEE